MDTRRGSGAAAKGPGASQCAARWKGLLVALLDVRCKCKICPTDCVVSAAPTYSGQEIHDQNMEFSPPVAALQALTQNVEYGDCLNFTLLMI